MLHTYRAILVKDRVQWQDEAPSSEKPVPVMVTLMQDLPAEDREPDGPAMAEALREIAARGGLAEIGDASEWQWEVRKDRPLPGRDE